jgi:hypothetical protein
MGSTGQFDFVVEDELGENKMNILFRTPSRPLIFAKFEDPDCVVNSLVSINGGSFGDNLTVVGSYVDDSYQVTDDGVVGGGLTIDCRRRFDYRLC